MSKTRKIKIEKDIAINVLAEEFKITPEVLKQWNPHLDISFEWNGRTEEIVRQNQIVLLPPISLDEFIPETRYRCSQDNIILIDGQPHFSCETKTQYLLSSNDNYTNMFSVNLEEYINSITPNGLEDSFGLIKEIEHLRTGIILSSQNKENTVWNVENMEEIQKNWEKFVDEKLDEVSFAKELKKRNPKTLSELIESGNKEFSSSDEFISILRKSLFYHFLFFAKRQTEKEEQSIIEYQSQIFPDVKSKLVISSTKVVLEDEKGTKVRLVGVLDKNSFNENKLRAIYDKMYKPIIQFPFSEYDIVYRMEYEMDNDNRLVGNANAYIEEMVKNNYQIISNFDMRQIAL